MIGTKPPCFISVIFAKTLSEIVEFMFTTNFMNKSISQFTDFIHYMKRNFTAMINGCTHNIRYRSNHKMHDALRILRNAK